MALVSNLQIRTVEARRFQKMPTPSAQIRIDNNLSVTSLEPGGENTAQVEFSYTASYGTLGVIRIDGAFSFQDVSVGPALTQWKEKRQMPGELASTLHTTIMQACVPEAVMLAKTIHLPPPIPMPRISIPQKGEAKGRAELDPSVG